MQSLVNVAARMLHTLASQVAHTVVLMQKDELNRLRDGEGRPPGVMGWWPSRATTFLENHDTVSVCCNRNKHRQAWPLL